MKGSEERVTGPSPSTLFVGYILLQKLYASLCSLTLLQRNEYRQSNLSDFCEITLLQILQ